MRVKKALITGIAGQDGSYLSELLLNLGYQVIGIVKDKTKIGNLKNIQNKIELYELDLSNFSKLRKIILEIKPSQIYNLGGITTLSLFDSNPSYSFQVTDEAARVILDTAVNLKERGHEVKVFQASSCLIFGAPKISPQNEQTTYNPITLYAKAKLNVDLYARKLREREKLNVSCGILYNHESPRRPLDYVTRKITASAACIYNKVKKIPQDNYGNPILTDNFKLKIGNIVARRDWGDARDFVKAYLLMLESDSPDDYIIATGRMHSVQDILEISFSHLNLNWRDHTVVDAGSIRSKDPHMLCGNSAKARTELGWIPKFKFEDTIKDMVEADVKLFAT